MMHFNPDSVMSFPLCIAFIMLLPYIFVNIYALWFHNCIFRCAVLIFLFGVLCQYLISAVVKMSDRFLFYLYFNVNYAYILYHVTICN